MEAPESRDLHKNPTNSHIGFFDFFLHLFKSFLLLIEALCSMPYLHIHIITIVTIVTIITIIIIVDVCPDRVSQFVNISMINSF